VQQHRLLLHQNDVPADLLQRQSPQIMIVEPHHAAIRVE
jgi:hypothetical protein